MSVVAAGSRNTHVWSVIKSILEEQRQQRNLLQEDLSFYVYRADTNSILARGILGYDAAKQKADEIRKQQGLPWALVKFKAEPRTQRAAGQRQQDRFGVSRGTFTSARGERSRVDYARNVNPSKGRRFRGHYDAQGNYHDID